jgi:hypothetical protein
VAGDSILWDMAEAYLDAAVAGLAPARRPDRQIVCAGPNFAHDNCDFIAIELLRMYPSRLNKPGRSSDRPTPSVEGPQVRVASYQITL